MNKFIIQPTGGLANKLRNITSTRVLSKYMEYDHSITGWIENEHSPGFDTIFKCTNGFNLSENLTEEYKMIDPLDTPFEIDELKQHQTIFMKGHNIVKSILPLPKVWDRDYMLTLNELELKDEIKNRIPELPDYCIGVHIRRTDNVESIQNSSVEDFINIIKTYPYNPIFLTTDDKNVENEIKTLFGDQIIVNEKQSWDNGNIIHWGHKEWFTNNDPRFTYTKEQLTQALIEAVVDFYTLSKTMRIYGSYWSSFTQESAKINNTELTIVRK